MAGRLCLVCGTLLVLMVALARGAGSYQSTKDGKTLVWNSNPKPGDIATWSGDRDHNDYAAGFGLLVWYTKQADFDKPQLYARYWGRMVDGKLEGPVNLHAKRKTHYAIFIDGTRVTGWAAGTAPTRATVRWRILVANRRPNIGPQSETASAEELRRGEPEAPAAGPAADMSQVTRRMSQSNEPTIPDIYSGRWPKIDIDDSLRLLAFPPRTLRGR